MKLNTDSLLSSQTSEVDFDLDEETLVQDYRASARPMEMIEQKLVASMRSGSVNLSHLQTFSRPHDR